MLWQYIIPQHLLSRLLGRLADCKLPWLKNLLIRLFISRYGVDMSQAKESDARSYATFNAFFTRALKPGIRPLSGDENTLVCPADGQISQIGNIKDGRIFQAKGQDFSLVELLGGSEQLAAPFVQGKFVTLYLSPKDYHRVHIPYAGQLEEMRYIPGQLFSVNQQSVVQIPRLFARNERLVTLFKTAFGPMAVILVGAMVVAGIETVWAGRVAPDADRKIKVWSYVDQAITLARGAELGQFRLGSTVIVLLPPRVVQWSELEADQLVCMGQKLGYTDKSKIR